MDVNKQGVVIFILISIFTTSVWKHLLRGPTDTGALWTTARDTTTEQLIVWSKTDWQNNLKEFYPFPNLHILL